MFLLSQGSLGVEVFIFISGFLMTLILKDATSLDAPTLRKFYVRRFFRIAPAFYAAIFLYVALRPFFTAGLAEAEAFFNTPYHISGLHDLVDKRSILLNLLFLHGLFPGEATKIFGPAWSLSLEMQFYLVAPFCVWLFRRQPFATLGILFAINFIGNRIFGVYGHSGMIADFTYPSFLPNRIFLFFLGGSYCVYLFECSARNLAVFLSSLAMVVPLIGPKSSFICLLLIGIIHLAIFSKGRWRVMWTRIADSKPTHVMAEWSYGIYLFHMFCMAVSGHLLLVVAATLSPPLAFALYAVAVVASSVVLAALMHAFVEKPARDYGRKISRRRSATTR